MSKYFIFDRDGTLINHIHHLKEISSVRIFHDAFEVLSRLQIMGFRLAIVTNQSVVGRGITTMSNVDSINSFIVESFAKQNVVIDFVKVCPHTPEDSCKCRKPKIGMLDKEISSGIIDPKKSYLVGDQESDVLFGNRLGMTTIRLMGNALDGTSADFVVNSLNEIPGIVDVK